MPIVTDDSPGVVTVGPTVNPVEIVTIKTSSPSYIAIETDTKTISRSNLLTHIEGSSWTVDYYSQVIDVDSQLSGQQLTVSPVYQQYKKIVKLELKVSTPLTTVQDPDTKVMALSGTALLYPFMIPNEGDMFSADIGEGKTGVFRITSTVKKSIFKEAVYEITYSLDTDLPGKLIDLEQKTVTTDYFHKDFLNYGQNPLVSTSDQSIFLELQQVYAVVSKQYFKKFLSNEYKTLILPGQPNAVYDHFLVDFVLSQFSARESNEILYLRKLNVDDDSIMKNDSLWTALKNKDISYLNTCFKQVGLVNTQSFTSDPINEGIRYTGITNVVYPIDPILSVDDTINNSIKTLSSDVIIEATASLGQLNTMVRSINLRALGNSSVVSIYDVTVDPYYVLSANFYNATDTQSVLEGIVTSYLKGEALNSAQLLTTAKLYTSWGLLEQFYYLPILMTLIRSVLRGL